MFLVTCGALTRLKKTHHQAADHQGGEAPTQLIFIKRKGVRHLPSGVPPAPKIPPTGGNQSLALNGICIVMASSVCVKIPSCSRLKLLIPVWAVEAYKQPERGQFISLRTTMMAVCAIPAPGNGDAGNGTHSTAAWLFRIWKCPYFDFEIYTCIERLRGSSKWKEIDWYCVWWPC